VDRIYKILCISDVIGFSEIFRLKYIKHTSASTVGDCLWFLVYNPVSENYYCIDWLKWNYKTHQHQQISRNYQKFHKLLFA